MINDALRQLSHTQTLTHAQHIHGYTQLKTPIHQHVATYNCNFLFRLFEAAENVEIKEFFF